MLRFQSQVQVSAIADEAVDNQFEVIMPTFDISDFSRNNCSCRCNVFTDALRSLGVTSYTPIVEQISFTPQTLKVAQRRVRTGWINLAEDLNAYGDVSITMFCSAGMLTQYYMEAWRSVVYNEEGEFFYPASNYKKNIEIYIYGPGNLALEDVSAVAHFTLKGCFPHSQETLKFKYSNNPKRITITASFKVDKIVFDEGKANSSITQELATSPMSLLDNAVNRAVSTINPTVYNPYSLSDTYR